MSWQSGFLLKCVPKPKEQQNIKWGCIHSESVMANLLSPSCQTRQELGWCPASSLFRLGNVLAYPTVHKYPPATWKEGLCAWLIENGDKHTPVILFESTKSGERHFIIYSAVKMLCCPKRPHDSLKVWHVFLVALFFPPPFRYSWKEDWTTSLTVPFWSGTNWVSSVRDEVLTNEESQCKYTEWEWIVLCVSTTM